MVRGTAITVRAIAIITAGRKKACADPPPGPVPLFPPGTQANEMREWLDQRFGRVSFEGRSTC